MRRARAYRAWDRAEREPKIPCSPLYRALCEDCHKEYHKQYGYKNNNYKDFRTFLYNEMMKQNTLEARLFYINTIEDITLRLEIRGLLGLESA